MINALLLAMTMLTASSLADKNAEIWCRPSEMIPGQSTNIEVAFKNGEYHHSMTTSGYFGAKVSDQFPVKLKGSRKNGECRVIVENAKTGKERFYIKHREGKKWVASFPKEKYGSEMICEVQMGVHSILCDRGDDEAEETPAPAGGSTAQ